MASAAVASAGMVVPDPAGEYTCLNCSKKYPIQDGVFCIKTTPFYQLTNCSLPLPRLIELVREYDMRQTDPDDKIINEYNYSRPEEVNLEVLCSILATKLRLDAPKDTHFICKHPCLKDKIKEYFSKTNLETWNGIIPCCVNGIVNVDTTEKYRCESYYDTADLLEKVKRPTRLIIQDAILKHQEFVYKRKQLASTASALAASVYDGDEKHELDSKTEEKQELDSKTDETVIQHVFTQSMELMIPKCPKCQAAFVDWANCYSVTCSCGVNFCGVCLTFYGTSRETHDHIRTMCKKHEEWAPVNPVCNYYGSYPSNTALMYIKVQSHTASWIEERRKAHKDPWLDAPTILEKVMAYLKSQPMSLRKIVIERMFREMRHDFRLGRKKEFFIENVLGEIINAGEVFYGFTPIATKFLLADYLITRDRDDILSDSTLLLSDTFFPLNLLSFMDPVNFYDIIYEGDYIESENEECMLVEQKLRHRLKAEITKPNLTGIEHNDIIFLLFRETLIKYEAVIAGGFVLDAVSPFSWKKTNQDIDLYVNLRHAKECIFKLLELGFAMGKQHMAPAYDESFMQKNNIIARISFNAYSHPGSYPAMDVMIIKDDTPVEYVVTHFDLTICQVWYDGKTVKATHWGDIKSKHGSLNPDYHRTYISGNKFIHNRINKYKKRGFIIDAPEINPEVAPLLQRLEELNEGYRRSLTLLYESAAGSPAWEAAIQETIEKDSREIRNISTLIYRQNRKTLTGENKQRWVLLKMYEELMNHTKYVLVLSFPLYPITYARFLEIARALHVNVREIFDNVFNVELVAYLPQDYVEIVEQARTDLSELMRSGKRIKTARRQLGNRNKTIRKRMNQTKTLRRQLGNRTKTVRKRINQTKTKFLK
jgi:hypothetical protein